MAGRPKGSRKKRCWRGHDLTQGRNVYYRADGERECALCSLMRAKRKGRQRRREKLEMRKRMRMEERARKREMAASC